MPSTREHSLYNALHTSTYCSPTIKEFNEAYAFANATKNYFGIHSIDYIIDVAGGHGALAAIYLLLTSTKVGIVIDPSVCNSGIQGVQAAWGNDLKGKVLRYRHEALETALEDEIQSIVGKGVDRSRILVVACHACQFLTDEVLSISDGMGVQVCVMPCCQKDTTGGSNKAFAKDLGVDIGVLIDMMTAGKMTKSYDVKLKLLSKSITPQNRLIMCKLKTPKGVAAKEAQLERSRVKLNAAYRAAHRPSSASLSLNSDMPKSNAYLPSHNYKYMDVVCFTCRNLMSNIWVFTRRPFILVALGFGFGGVMLGYSARSAGL